MEQNESRCSGEKGTSCVKNAVWPPLSKPWRGRSGTLWLLFSECKN
uniref:GTPase, IMAP family member 2 n=1 Tax=Propithecus coquereli TaxID=379532 RepID=A0A2K6GDT4_PROCO